MARKSYLFRTSAVDPGLMESIVSAGDPVKKAMTPCILEYVYEIDEEYLGDLVEFMESQKWTFVDEDMSGNTGVLPLIMAATSGAMYDILVDDSDPMNPILRITPRM